LWARFYCFKVPVSVVHNAKGYLLAAVLLGMLALDPVLRCLGHAPVLTQHCEAGDAVQRAYTVPSMVAVLLLYLFVSDLCVFSNRIAAIVLMFIRLTTHMALFLICFAVVLLAFATAAAALKIDEPAWESVWTCAVSMIDIFMGTTQEEELGAVNQADGPALKILVTVFYFVTGVYLLNLLVAQLVGAYSMTFEDMMGFARLKRGAKVVEALGLTSYARWSAFVRALDLDKPVSFIEGDVGMPGGLEVMEPASIERTNVDTILRYGGTTSPDAPWPEEDSATTDEVKDRLERIDVVIRKLAKKLDKPVRRGGGKGGSTSGMFSGMDSAGSPSRFSDGLVE